jgi:2-succinyl-5-enolpyruvyl-6-hydroxy-3-cyclohexene-1-carboxylate synthase
MNSTLARETLNALFEKGLREVCVCPGSRNAPWIHLLTDAAFPKPEGFRAYYFFEERSASFFALGRIRASGKPVAVMTTSGTAAGELMAATMEAYYSGLPLVLLTADRPRRFRGTGAPQTAEQVGLFGVYTSTAIDVAGGETLCLPASLSAPLHLNVCFEEPTQAESATPVDQVAAPSKSVPAAEAWKNFSARVKCPLVVVGSLAPEERDSVRDFLLRLQAPVYLEALSGLRECPELERVRIHLADRIFERAGKSAYPIDGVLRIGGVPTHRLWRDLEDRFTEMPVLCVSRMPLPGLSRASAVLSGDIRNLLADFSVAALNLKAQGLHEADRMSKKVLQDLLDSEPGSEPGMVHQLSKHLPRGAQLFLGNSLPIREWDLAASWEDKQFEVRATRGVNGIDGQISTFLGLCDPEKPNWALIGDLTALYDLAGPWALSQLSRTRADIVVLNNGGGKIFQRMYAQSVFQNPHQVRFEGLASLWGLEYVAATSVNAELTAQPTSGKSRLIELIPDEAATGRFWKEYLRP